VIEYPSGGIGAAAHTGKIDTGNHDRALRTSNEHERQREAIEDL